MANIHLNFKVSLNYTAYGSSIGSNTTYDVSSSENTRTYYEAPGTERFYSNVSIMKRIAQTQTWNNSWNTFGYRSPSESSKIGRATGRERVGQELVITGVASTFKKKKQKKH